MHVRPGVLWVDAPERYITGHGWSELLHAEANKDLSFTRDGKKFVVTISKATPKDKRREIEAFLRELGFDGLTKFEINFTKDPENVIITVIVD